jgi:hypothetical protein
VLRAYRVLLDLLEFLEFLGLVYLEDQGDRLHSYRVARLTV